MILVATGVSLGCATEDAPARDQWTVWFTTDAPVPQVVDRALVEVLDERGELACADCRLQSGLPSSPSGWPLSFGIVPPPGAPPGAQFRVRVRLYRASRSYGDGRPREPATIDRVGILPPAHGETAVAMRLLGECIGAPSRLDAHETCEGPARALVPETMLTLGKPEATLIPGTWERSARRPCPSSAPAPGEMVCVPGGSFLLGDASLEQLSNVASSPVPEQFVTVSPFLMDRDEVTVGAVRALVRGGLPSVTPSLHDSDPLSPTAQCTYLGADDATNDDQAVTCLGWSAAAKVCEVLGKRLPTEAEWEWAAGNLERETRYPWGDGGDPCSVADVGLGGLVGYESQLNNESRDCRFPIGQSPRPVGLPRVRNPGDVTGLGIRGLGGGVSEWVADLFSPYTASCWTSAALLSDPRCNVGGGHAFRGGSWRTTAADLAVASRDALANENLAVSWLGLRCARDAR